MKFIGLIVIAAMCCLASARLNAQEIILTRTGTDSLHSSFVTATKLIAFDVSTSGIERCTGVTFELRYTLAKYVRFSGSTVEALGRKVSSVVIPRLDTASGDGIIYIGVLTGDSVGSIGYLNPRVIHLEFVVTQSVPDGEALEFSFDNAQAVIARDSSGSITGEIVSLNSTPVSYLTHSFINVWPGDADNNGLVDTRDISAVGLYLDYGMPGNTMRSFRREPASTLWFPQPVLAWDSTIVTYADCDGNGTVTITDMLVIPLNFGKATSKAIESGDLPQVAFNNCETAWPEGAVRIPVHVNSYMPFIGAAGKITWNTGFDASKVLGIEKGDMFGKESFFYSKIDNNSHSAVIASGETVRSSNPPVSGVLAYIVLQPGENAVGLNASTDELNGISDNGYVFPLSAIASADDEGINETGASVFEIKDNILTFGSKANILQFVKIYDIMGNLVYYSTSPREGNNLSIDISGFNKGTYFISIDGRKACKFAR